MIKTTNEIIDWTDEQVEEACHEAKFHQDYWTEQDERTIKNHVLKEKWVNLEELEDWLNEFKPKQTQISALLDKLKTEQSKGD